MEVQYPLTHKQSNLCSKKQKFIVFQAYACDCSGFIVGPFIHNIDPIFGQIGAFHLWWYGLSYTLVFLALFHGFRTVREPLGLDAPQVYDLTIWIAAGVLIGGRAVEVIFYEWAYYSQHPSRIFWIWLVGQVESSVTLSRATSIVGKAQSAGNGRPFPRAATPPTMLVARPFGSRCASATLCCVSCQGRGHCLRNAP